MREDIGQNQVKENCFKDRFLYQRPGFLREMAGIHFSISEKRWLQLLSTYLTLSTGTKIKLSGGLLPVNVWNFFSSGTSGQWSRIEAAEVVSVSGGAAAIIPASKRWWGRWMSHGPFL